MFYKTLAEPTAIPDWTPLLHALEIAGPPLDPDGRPVYTPGQLFLSNPHPFPPEAAADFMWMCESPKGVHQYKHRDTRNYAHLTGTETREEAYAALLHAGSFDEKWKDRPVRTARIKETTNV